VRERGLTTACSGRRYAPPLMLSVAQNDSVQQETEFKRSDKSMLGLIKKLLKLFLLVIGIFIAAVAIEAAFGGTKSGGTLGAIFLVVALFVLVCYVVIGIISWLWSKVLKPTLPVAFLLVVIAGVATFIFVQTPIGQKYIPEPVQLLLIGTSSIWTATKLVLKFANQNNANE
jgi:hypothetical protein